LVGTIPAVFGRMSALTDLYVNVLVNSEADNMSRILDGDITGTIPSQIGSLSLLDQLCVYKMVSFEVTQARQRLGQ